MPTITRITFDSKVMGGKPCIRRMRVTVGTIVGLVASGHSKEAILRLYPYLEPEDIDEALAYAAWRVEWRSIQETIYLLNISGMCESIREGLATPLKECGEEPGW